MPRAVTTALWPSTSPITSARCAPERHPNPNFADALRHRVGHHAVDADRGERDGHAGERAKQHGVQARPGHRVRHQLFHRGDVIHGRLWLEIPDQAPHACRQSERLTIRAHGEVRRRRRPLPGELRRGRRLLPVVDENLRIRILVQIELSNVLDDSDNLPRRSPRAYICLPIGLSPKRPLRASVWLMSITCGWPAPSLSPNPRPAMIRTPITFRKSRLTTRVSGDSGNCRPSNGGGAGIRLGISGVVLSNVN